MFSTRFSWSFEENRLSRALAQKLENNQPIIDLTQSNPTAASFDYPESAIIEALASKNSLVYEPHPRGLPAARQALVHDYAARGFRLDADAIHLTTSTSEAYAYLFKLLANPGDEILVPRPSYPLFEFLTALESVRLVPYYLRYQPDLGWTIDLDSMANSISTKTAAIVVVNPNNPTGSYLKSHELDRISELCREFELAIISDEVFADYKSPFESKSPQVLSLVGIEEALCFVLGGLSKSCGLPQMKLAWIISNGPPALAEEAREKLDFICDTYLPVSTPIQQAAPSLLTLRQRMQAQIIERVQTNESILQQKLGRNSSSKLLVREGGWYAIVALSGETEEEALVLEILQHDDVLVHPGYFFDLSEQGYLVFSLLPIPAEFEEGVSRITKYL